MAHKRPDGIWICCARHLHQDFVGPDGLDDRLGDAGAVDPLLHDRPDDFHVGGGRLALTGRGNGPIQDLEATLQVQTELRLGRLPKAGVDVAQDDKPGARHEIDPYRDHAEDQDEERH